MSLLLTAGTSAIMSVYAVYQVFSNNILPAMMAAGMEVGKILIIIYSHRNWGNLKFVARSYYCLIVGVLVLLTSISIFATLSQEYAKNSSETSLISSRLNSLASEHPLLLEDLKTLEKTLSGLPSSYVSKRFQFRKENSYDDKRRRLLQINDEIAREKGKEIKARLMGGPIFIVSRLLEMKDEIAIILFICILVGVAEPLAVGLAVAVSSQWMPRGKVVGKMSPEHKERVLKEAERKRNYPYRRGS
jgi:hypothetical protein